MATSNPLHSNTSNNIFLMAVMRYSDKRIVANFIRNNDVTIEGLRECVASNASIQPGKRYSVQGSSFTISYCLDVQGRVYGIVTSSKYSPRITFAALDELQQMFNKELGMKVAASPEGGLTRASASVFKYIFDKYDNSANIDKLSAVQEKIDVVKSTMKENIQMLLINEEKLKGIEAQTEHLNDQAKSFNKGSKELANKMWWKMWKMRLLIGGLIIAVLLIIIVPIAVSNSKSK